MIERCLTSPAVHETAAEFVSQYIWHHYDLGIWGTILRKKGILLHRQPVVKCLSVGGRKPLQVIGFKKWKNVDGPTNLCILPTAKMKK